MPMIVHDAVGENPHRGGLLSCHQAALERLKIPAGSKQRHFPYAPIEDVHLCVVVAPSDADERFVVTTYFTENIKKGTELWRS